MVNTSLCSLSFNYQGENHLVTGLNLQQADFERRFRESNSMDSAHRKYLSERGTKSYALELNCVLREVPAHKALLKVISENKTEVFTIKLGNNWSIIGPFLICKAQLKANGNGCMVLQINLESNGEVKNDL